MSTDKGKRKLTPGEEEIEKVKSLIKQCMVHNLNPKEVIDVLYKQQKIERSFTETVLQELETQDKEFFDNYYSRLIMKELHKKQPEMTNQSNIPPSKLFSVSRYFAVKLVFVSTIIIRAPCVLTAYQMQYPVPADAMCFDFPFEYVVDDTRNDRMGLLAINIESGGYLDNLSTSAIEVIFDLGASSFFLERVSTRLKQEMHMVKNLIEQCLLHYMNKEQVMDILYQKENIGYAFTKTVWEHLEQQNQEYFKNYYLRLAAKDQIIEFNNLLEKQAAMMNHKFNVPATATAPELDIDRHRLGILGLQFQIPPATTPALQSAPPATDEQQSGSG
ncbi:hypothetical protein L1987_37479 [Smallanthus sonchifolius]|uniref:Uncharacterized protein n=1 Tax=Smallanthus sonchifolius TaxID=185202 RepID=A0ACB9HGH0_9ASTR|nr:hypothetical protein L1987_37479 [Smallanthus sonchifolius]